MASDVIYREDAKIFVRHACYKKFNPIDYLDEVPAADVRPVVRAHWNLVGKQMVINLANAREQYSELGYPHRNILQMQCDKCGLITMVDESIRYDYCPHCGADMREPNLDTTKGDNHDY